MAAYNYDCETMGMLFDEQCRLAQDKIFQEIEANKRTMLQIIPDGGPVGPHENHESLIYSYAPTGPVNYQSRNANSAVPGLVPGSMMARACDGQNTMLSGNVSELSGDLCDENRITVTFNRGVRRVAPVNFTLPIISQVFCAETFNQYAPNEVASMFSEYTNKLTNWALDNFDWNLSTLAIKYGQTNSSVISGQGPNYQTGGWVAPPTGVLTIAFVKEWAAYWRRLERPGRLTNNTTERSDPPTIRIPEADWMRMVSAHQSNVFGNSVVNIEYGVDPFSNPYQSYAGVRWIADEFPRRGYFSGGQFVEIFRTLPADSTDGIEAGIGGKPNPDYDSCFIMCNGINHRVVTLIQIIDPAAFSRRGLENPWAPTQISSNNLQLKLVSGADILPLLQGCGDNINHDKWAYSMRHKWQFKPIFPMLAGSIVYLHDKDCPYSLAPCCTDACETSPPDNFQRPPTGSNEAHGPTPCALEHCIQCGHDGADNFSCVDTVPGDFLALNSCGTVTSVLYEGTTNRVVFKVTRMSSNGTTLTLPYSIAAGTAVAGVNYNDVTTPPGVLTWEPFDNTPKMVTIDVIASSGIVGTDLTLTLTFVPPVGVAFNNCASVILEIAHCPGTPAQVPPGWGPPEQI